VEARGLLSVPIYKFTTYEFADLPNCVCPSGDDLHRLDSLLLNIVRPGGRGNPEDVTDERVLCEHLSSCGPAHWTRRTERHSCSPARLDRPCDRADTMSRVSRWIATGLASHPMSGRNSEQP